MIRSVREKRYIGNKIRQRGNSGTSDARLDYIVQRFADSRSVPELKRLRKLYTINLNAYDQYKMTRYPGIIDVFPFDFSDNYEIIPDQYFGWEDLADEIRVHPVPGKDHPSVLKTPYVGDVDAKLMKILLEAEKETLL